MHFLHLKNHILCLSTKLSLSLKHISSKSTGSSLCLNGPPLLPSIMVGKIILSLKFSSLLSSNKILLKSIKDLIDVDFKEKVISGAKWEKKVLLLIYTNIYLKFILNAQASVHYSWYSDSHRQIGIVLQFLSLWVAQQQELACIQIPR